MAALENIALWHERDISHSSVERVILPDSFIALDHMLRRFTRIVARHGRLSGADAREPRSARAASCFRARCCSSWRGAASRASRPTSGCSGTPCGRSTSSSDFKALLLADPDVDAGAARRPRSRRRSISTISSGTSTRSSTGCSCTRHAVSGPDQSSGFRVHGRKIQEKNESARVRHAEAVGLRSAGADHRRRAALDGLRRRRRRAAGQVLRARV